MDEQSFGLQYERPGQQCFGRHARHCLRDEFIAQVTGFGKLIPDLAWDIKEVVVDGNRVIVRSAAAGTPCRGPGRGDFATLG